MQFVMRFVLEVNSGKQFYLFEISIVHFSFFDFSMQILFIPAGTT